MNKDETAAAVISIGASHLLHLAWTVTHGEFWTAPSNLDWLAATLTLYRAFVEADGRRAVMAGTCAEYDWSFGTLNEGDTPLRPRTLYGTAKHAVHELLAKSAAEDGVELAWGRVFFLYGPHEGRARLVPSIVLPLLQGLQAQVGEGRALRDFMHVQDVADAFVATLASAFTGPVNIATGLAVPIRYVITTIAAQIGQPNLVSFGTRAVPDYEPPVLATTARNLHGIGFKPRFTLETGLEDTIAWWSKRL